MKEVKKLFDEFLSDYSTGPEDELMLADLRRLVNAVKEECAKKCKTMQRGENPCDTTGAVYYENLALEEAAKAIRALDLSGETPE